MHCASLIVWIVIAASMFAFACGDDDFNPYEFVGSACRSSVDCAPGAQCESGGDFPDGTCTFECRNHSECPHGSACVDVHGGICLVACGSDPFCRPGYRCRERKDRGAPGESRVCIK
jgi:hypothetical protein